MKPVAALVAITLVLLVGPLAGAAGADEPLGAPAPGPVRVDPDQAAGPLRLDVSQLGPRVVTANGSDTLTVVGTLTNTGDRPVDELVVRVQRSEPLRTEGQLRDALDGSAATDAVTPQFTPLPGVLAPGEQVPVRLAVPLRGAPQEGLALGAPGVYELLVNVNGVPEDGARARLAGTRLLLPVLSLPAGPDGEDAVPPQPVDATPFAMLYPITDVPHRVSTVPGPATLLTDDSLAASLAPDGRLGGLLSALTDSAPAGSPVRQAICLAIDPDLVDTVASMRGGYDYLGPDGRPVPGAGAAVAAAWLDELTAVAAGTCVLALPYADADLVPLTRGGQGALATGAVGQGRQVLTQLLGVPVVDDATWPAAGLLDGQTMDAVAAAGNRTVLLSADGVEQRRTPRVTGVVPIEATQPTAEAVQTAVLTDPLLTSALTGPAARGQSRSGAAAAVSSPAGGAGALATQDGIGALAFRVQGGDATDDGPLVLAPPHAWGVTGTGAEALLDGVEALVRAGMLRPRAADALSPPVPPGAALPLAYPIDAAAGEVPQDVVAAVADTAAAVADLRSAARPGSPIGVSPEQAFAPLERGLVRPASAAWRGRDADAETAARAARQRIDALRASVRVLEPPGPYALGTEDAPLLITVANDLPVTMEVQVEIAPSPGLRVAPIGPQEIPPLGRRQISASAEVTRTGQFTVQASVRTPGGELLGPPSRLRMRSTVYGTITLWLTGSAGVLLVVLAARRVVRRSRGELPERREIVLGPRPGSPPASGTASTAAERTGTEQRGSASGSWGNVATVAEDGPTQAMAVRPVRSGDPFPDPQLTVPMPGVRRGPEQPPPAGPTSPTGSPTEATERLPPTRRPRPPEPPRVGSR
ncbi:hypothetical protein [Pseudonocardia humida]|uniref:Glycoprotein n=1 Tax=Pseudonocardia humida TaxID=2800819 RepID=A0ABT1ABH1_9PSEU|nr:hypothetical protein [Pseudonocardia humida]MCO1660338.1 hypothetical protein [Pseudonocardia humida]